MEHQAELIFLQQILTNMHLHSSILQEPFENANIHDCGIRNLVYPAIDYPNYIKEFCHSCRTHVIYKAYDEFLFNYLILKFSAALYAEYYQKSLLPLCFRQISVLLCYLHQSEI